MLISLHIRSMWETICDAQAGFWLNSKFLSKFSGKPLSRISDRKAPPISENFRFEMTKVYSRIPPLRKLQIWDDQSLLQNTPPPPFWKTSDLGWPKFTPEYPSPNENCERVQVREFQNTESYYMWRLYPTRITTRLFCEGLIALTEGLHIRIWQCSHSDWKTWKMGRHFPVGNFELENHTIYWKTQAISDKYYLLFFSDI